jgi:peptidoglycan/LPS O-acetylase OafA/YrhL
MNKSKRFMNLEGLRGIAAIAVVAYHIVIMFYPAIAYGLSTNPAPVLHSQIEGMLYGNPLNVFLSGAFAVGVFFVLSGFVLSIGFFQTGKELIVKKLASKRYLRLMLPALASVILSFILFSLHLNGGGDITHPIANSGLPADWGIITGFIEAVREGTYGIFFNSEAYYNPVLWTMAYEFTGSFIVFLLLLLVGKSKYRWFVYGAFLFATFGTWYIGFILGTVIADLYVQKKLAYIANRRALGIGMLVAGLLIGGYPFGPAAGTIYGFISLPWMIQSANIAVFISIGAALVVVGVLSLERVSRFFALPRVSTLGRFTYSLYLTHYIIITTLGLGLFSYFNHTNGYNTSVALTCLCILPVIAVVTWLFERYIDAPSIKFANYVSDIVMNSREVDLKLKSRLKRFLPSAKDRTLLEPEE